MFLADRTRSSDVPFETGNNENHFLYTKRRPQQGNAAKSLSIPVLSKKTSSREWRSDGRRRPTASCELRFTFGNIYKKPQKRVLRVRLEGNS